MVNGQITFSGKGKVCLGDVTNFSYKAPSGVSVISEKWSFGDGSTSNQINPSHLFKDTGYFLVSVNVQSNSGTYLDSLKIEVVGLPIAKLSILNSSDFCFLSNRVCVQDSSVPFSSNQALDTVLVLWGDGSFLKFSNANSGPFCHTFSNTGSYKISLEVQDVYGCKAFDVRDVDVLPDVSTKIASTDTIVACNQRKFCFSNGSNVSTGAKVDYFWQVNDTNHQGAYIDSSLCRTFFGNDTIVVRLIGQAKYGCLDTAIFVRELKELKAAGRLYANDSSGCYSTDSLSFEIRDFVGNRVEWYLNGNHLTEETKLNLSLNFKGMGLSPGKHQVKSIVYNDSCKVVLSKQFEVLGPKAQIKLYYNEQCQTTNRVFFVSESIYLDTANTRFYWDIKDPYGSTCTNSRKDGVNLYKNCNFSTDWYTKHDFTLAQYDYKVHFTISDVQTGCLDTVSGYVNLDDCDNLRQFCNDTIEYCQGAKFFPNPGTGKKIFQVTLDGGRSWRYFPTDIKQSDTGILPIGFIFEDSLKRNAFDFGNDSIQLLEKDTAIYDTSICNGFLQVLPNVIDSIYITKELFCDSVIIKVNFKNGNFKAGELLVVKWRPGVRSNIYFERDTTVKVIQRTYPKSGQNIIFEIERTNQFGNCSNSKVLILDFGVDPFFSTKGALCSSNEICFKGRVRDNNRNWLYTDNNADHKVSWFIDGQLAHDSLFGFCHRFIDGGTKHIQMVVESSGCRDTLSDSLIIQKLVANVTEDSRFFFCNQNRQFFDSSYFLFENKQNDRIDHYYWYFDNNNFSSTLKDPFHSFVGEVDDVKAYHVVESKSGCRDTLHLNLVLIGSKPRFVISDSLGCAPLMVDFINTSISASGYIWEFNDQKKSTLSTNQKTSVNFTYDLPGIYYPKLVGIDTIFNPATSSVYYCNASFPMVDSVRKVVVLPSLKTGIIGPDSLCVNEEGLFLSQSDSLFYFDFWDMGNKDTFRLALGKPNSYSYGKPGTYQIKLKPYFPSLPNGPDCSDSAVKTVVVSGISVDFDIDQPLTPPKFNFTNTSSNLNGNFLWNYGQPRSSLNTSDDVHGSHNYGSDTGWFTVCLWSDSDFGCVDSACKVIYNDYFQSLIVYNIFTPGLIDGMNDEFDVVIDGENYYHLVVTNRWGQEVFRSTEDDINWNGKVFNEGDDCPGGTYYYVFKYSLNEDPDTIKEINGVVTLVR